jgi:hypothetical protein
VLVRCTKKGASTARRLSEQRRRLMRTVLADMEPSRRLLLADLLEEYVALFDRHQANPDTC